MIYKAERWGYFSLALIMLSLFLFPLDPIWVNHILTVVFLAVIAYHFILSRVYSPLDRIYAKRMLKPFYTPGENGGGRPGGKGDRKGALAVFVIYALYLSIVSLLTYFHLFITWNLILFWLFFLLGLNNIFIYKICLIRRWVMKRTNCCMDCRINGWDDMLIFSILPFLFAVYKPLSFFNGFLIITIMALSVFHLLLWEIGLLLFPERFFPETNAQLSCKNCGKKACVGTVKGRFSQVSRKA